jgi:hypothetical protein
MKTVRRKKASMRSLLDENSKNIVQTTGAQAVRSSAIPKDHSTVRGGIRGRGRRLLHQWSLGLVIRQVFDCKTYKF